MDHSVVARRTRGGGEHQHLVMHSKANGTVCVCVYMFGEIFKQNTAIPNP